MSRFFPGVPALLALVSCASAPSQQAASAPAPQAAPVVERAAVRAEAPRPSRKELVRRILPHNVRLQIADGGKARKSVLGPVDRLLGGGFGMLKGLLGATLFFLLANLVTDMIYGGEADRPEWMTDSRTYPLLNATGRAVVDWVETRRTAGDEA